jgi:serine/threonine-protein kinase
MGEVYRATNVSLGRKVAIKVLSREMVDNEDDVLRFLREARAAAAVRHPNVVDVLDVARDDDGTPFIVQELLSGEDLEHHARASGGRLPAEEALEILIPVADAVAEAHARDVVHRDLKPANIFLAREGARIIPKVLDFGACLFPTMGGVDTKELRMLIGTPHYMAPEQVTDRLGVDARADVWAIGVILWELVVGEAPFQGPTAMDVLRQVKVKEVPPLRERAPDAPRELEELVAACTKRDKTARMADASQLAARMRELLERLRPPPRPKLETMPEVVAASEATGGAGTEASLSFAPPAPAPAPVPPPPARKRMESEDDGVPSGLDLALDAKPGARTTLGAMPSELSPLDARGGRGDGGEARLPLDRPPSGEHRPLTPSSPLPLVPSGASTLTHGLRTPRTPVNPLPVPQRHLAGKDVGRLALCVAGPALGVHGLFRLVPLTRQLGHALRGDSVLASGVATVIVLVTFAALAAKSIAPDRKPTTAVSAGAALVLGIVMIIMTFSASESIELGIPPVASSIVPFIAPLLPSSLAYAMYLRARDDWADPAERRSAVLALVAASLLALLALEAGPTGAVRSAAALVATRAG